MLNFRTPRPTLPDCGRVLALALVVGMPLLEAGTANAAVALRVVPNSAADADAETDNNIPFGGAGFCGDGVRYQQLLDGSEIGTANITGLAFRLDGGESSDMDPFDYGMTTVKLSSTTATPSSMSDTLADNVGPDETLVYSGDFSQGATVDASPTQPFDFELPLDAPFPFDGSSKNLLLDISMSNCFNRSGVFRFFDRSFDALARRYAADKNASVADNGGSSGLVTQVTISSGALEPALYDCPFGGSSGDLPRRGFYLENFPAKRLDDVTLRYYPSQAGDYTVKLTAREGTYDGRVIGGPRTVSFHASGPSDAITRTFDFGGATVTEGATVTFSQEVVDQPTGSRLFYDYGSTACPDITQTNHTDPPLDTHRRDGVGVTVTAVNRMRGLGGNWTVVGHNGEGFMIDVTDAGQLVAIWFTYDEAGNQMWLIGVDNNFDSNTASMTMTEITGPSFGPDFDVADRMDRNWGTLQFSFDGCDEGTVNYNSTTGFGAGSYDIEKIYHGEQNNCP